MSIPAVSSSAAVAKVGVPPVPPIVTLPNTTQGASKSVVQPTNAYAGWRFNRDGTVDRMQNTSLGGWTYHHNWCDNPRSQVGDDFEIKYTSVSGTPNGEVTTIFQDLSSDLSIYKGVAVNKDDIVSETTVTIEIREKTNTSNSDTCNYYCGAYT